MLWNSYFLGELFFFFFKLFQNCFTGEVKTKAVCIEDCRDVKEQALSPSMEIFRLD